MCAICGDGMSVEPNLILFCERCDVAVHQQCYAIHSVPAGERLGLLLRLCLCPMPTLPVAMPPRAVLPCNADNRSCRLLVLPVVNLPPR